MILSLCLKPTASFSFSSFSTSSVSWRRTSSNESFQSPPSASKLALSAASVFGRPLRGDVRVGARERRRRRLTSDTRLPLDGLARHFDQLVDLPQQPHAPLDAADVGRQLQLLQQVVHRLRRQNEALTQSNTRCCCYGGREGGNLRCDKRKQRHALCEVESSLKRNTTRTK